MLEEARDTERLETILLLIERIERHLSKITLEVFVEDSDAIDLLSYRLAMIGEQTNKISAKLKSRFPDIPWKRIYGLRNIIAHEYVRVDPARIWQTATSELDMLKVICRRELGQLS